MNGGRGISNEAFVYFGVGAMDGVDASGRGSVCVLRCAALLKGNSKI